MNNITLSKLSAIMFVVGLIALFFIVLLIQPVQINIRDIGDEDIGKTVTINASVANKILRNGNLFLDLTDDNESYIKAVMFENDIRWMNLSDIHKNGYVNRLWQITLTQAKALLRVGNKPVIEYILENLEKTAVNEIIISINQKFERDF